MSELNEEKLSDDTVDLPDGTYSGKWIGKNLILKVKRKSIIVKTTINSKKANEPISIVVVSGKVFRG